MFAKDITDIEEFYSTGDVNILGNIYTRYRRPLRYWGYVNMNLRAELFPDAYHDFWLKMMVRFHYKVFDPTKGKLSSWLYACWRRFLQTRFQTPPPIITEYFEWHAKRSVDPCQTLIEAEFYQIWRTRLDNVCKDDQDKTILSLREEGLSIKEISGVLNLEISLVKVRLHRLRKKLQSYKFLTEERRTFRRVWDKAL